MQSVVSSQSRARRIQGEGDCLEEFLGIVGFFEERNGAAFECGFLQAFEAAGGDEDDRDVRQAQFMEALSNGEAEADRHPDVEEEQIGTLVDSKLETLPAVGGGSDVVAGGIEPNGECSGNFGVIFHNEDFFHNVFSFFGFGVVGSRFVLK